MTSIYTAVDRSGQPGSCHGGAGPDLGKLRRDPAFRLQRVKGVLQAQEISLRQAKKFAQAQIAVGGNIARALDDGVNAIGRHANGVRQPVLAQAQFIQKFLLQDFTGMRVMQQGHGHTLHQSGEILLDKIETYDSS